MSYIKGNVCAKYVALQAEIAAFQEVFQQALEELQKKIDDMQEKLAKLQKLVKHGEETINNYPSYEYLNP